MNKKIIPLLVLASSMMLASCGNKSSQGANSSNTGSDTASTDSGSTDSGSTDSGSTDSGSTDSGTTDSGSDTTPAAQSYSISSINLANAITISVASEAEAGSQVTVTATSEYDFYDDSEASAYFLYVNDSLTKISSWENKSLYYQFTMPSGDVELVLVQGGYSSTSGKHFTVINSEHIKLYGVDPEAGYSYVSARMIRKGDYAIDHITVDYGSGEVDYSSYNASFTDNLGDFSAYGFEGDATIKIYEKAVQAYNITWTNGDKILSELPTRVVSGEFVSLSCYNLTYAAGWTYNNGTVAEIKDASGNDVEATSNAYGSLYFEMPNSDITITFLNLVQSQSFNITKDEHVKSVSITDYSGNDKSYPKANESVYVHVELDEGYTIASITLNGTDLRYDNYYNAYSGYTSSTDGAVNELVITTGQSYAVTCQNAEGGSIELSASSFAVGATVEGYVRTTSKFYTLKSVKVLKDGAEDSSVVVTIDNSGYSTKISFTMPAYAITLVPEFEKSEGSHIASVTADSAITAWRISGNSSYTAIENTSTAEEIAAANFVEGETLQIQITHAAGYTVSAKIGDVEVNPSYDSGTTAYIYNGLSMVNNAVIELKAEAKTPVAITIDKSADGCADAQVSFVVNNETVENLYKGDEFKIVCSGDAGEGKGFVAKAYDADGEELEKNYYGEYICNGAFKVVVEIAEGGIVTINQCCTNMYLSVQDENYDDIASGSLVLAGATVYVSAYVYSAHHITITVGEETVVDADLAKYDQGNYDIVVAGNVTITLTDIA